MQFSTRAIHTGGANESAAGDVVPPIHLTTIYSYAEPGVTQAGYEYIRYGMPLPPAPLSALVRGRRQ
ncbi:MAG: hypothetical protein NT023_03175 [Armatimonadetes bacterium]|nr:hypothetical protein [Armatimonadota bacterium]